VTTSLAGAATEVASSDSRATSSLARSLFHDLMAVEPLIRRGFFKGLPPSDQREVLKVALVEGGTPLAIYRDDPVGFIEDVLDETLWSKSREVVSSVADHEVTAVPSCFGSSKTWGAARVDLWWTQTQAPGTALAITIAPLWRQVVRQMWPEIRRAHHRANLPGQVDTFQMKMTTHSGGRPLTHTVSYGLVANKHDESAVQGIHSPNLLLVVDEAGGISPTVGRNLRAVLTGDNSRMLAIGNPPADDEGSWFEQLCQQDRVNTIVIDAYSTPQLSGEKAPRCKSCPPGLPAHSMAKHLVDPPWVKDTIREYGEDSPYVQAKVYARFPRGGKNRALPYSWVEMANKAEDPDPNEFEDYVALGDLGLRDEKDPTAVVKKHGWVRLGVDVAADGGDEFVVARSVAELFTVEHYSSGQANADPHTVAGVILAEINKAQLLADAIESPWPVRVKIDTIGVGWGVVGIMETWAKEGIHRAQIVPVNVAESTDRDPDPKATFRPRLKRDELWLNFRELLPRPDDYDDPDEPAPLRLRLDKRTLAQLTAPELGNDSQGRTVVEGKDSLKRRGMSSPDRGEAVLLAAYEPAPKKPKRKKARVLVN
jgi:hypothetical protein